MIFSTYSLGRFFTLAAPVTLALGMLVAAGTGAPKLQGTWGGEKAIIKVNESGADLEFECAHGRINQAIQPGQNGDFELPGTLIPEGHGPVRDGPDNANRVRFHGHVQDRTLTLTILSGDEKIGPYTLTRDNEPILKKCR